MGWADQNPLILRECLITGGVLPTAVLNEANHHDDNSGGPPTLVIVTIRDYRDYIRVLLYSYYTTITGVGVLLDENDP